MALQFVQRGDLVRVLRTAEGGRRERQVLGSISRSGFVFRPAAGTPMTEAEAAEVEGYCVYRQLREGIRQKLAAHEFEDTVRDVLAYFATVEDPTERQLLRRQIEAAARQLRVALRPA